MPSENASTMKEPGLIERLLRTALIVVVGSLLSLAVYIFWQEDLQKRFGVHSGFAILASLILFSWVALYLGYRLIRRPAKLIFETVVQNGTVARRELEELLERNNDTLNLRIEQTIRKAIREEEEEKIRRLREKYREVVFKDVRSVNEFSQSETSAVKIGLMKGVQHCVRAISRIGPSESDSLPLTDPDERNYFDESKEALKRIRSNHPPPAESREYTIHRVYVIFGERLKEQEQRRKIEDIIKEQCELGFDVRVAVQEELKESQAYTFAIYDDEIVLRLSYDQHMKKSAEGTVYFNDAVVNDVYRERYRQIEAQSYRPDEFWKKYSQPS